MKPSINKLLCPKCDVRIIPSRQNLICSLCRQVKHQKCENLSKKDVDQIDNTYQISNWICSSCISEILPIEAVDVKRCITKKVSTLKFKLKCPICTGMSYSERNIDTCNWCGVTGHKKCIKGALVL